MQFWSLGNFDNKTDTYQPTATLDPVKTMFRLNSSKNLKFNDYIIITTFDQTVP